MFNINYFESFAQSNGLPLGPSINMPTEAGGVPAESVPAQEAIPYEECSLPERGNFPEETLPPVLLQYARDLAAVYQIPVELPALSMVAAVSGCLGKFWEGVNACPGRRTRGNFYMVLSLPPGAGKSVANRVVKPILQLEQRREETWKRERVPQLKSEMEALVHCTIENGYSFDCIDW